MIDVKLDVTLTLDGPILTQSSAPGDPGIDTPMARNRNNKYFLPYSLVRGKLSQSWKELAEATDNEFNPDTNDLLGKPSSDVSDENPGDFDPMRGRLRFPTDFESKKEAGSYTRKYRIPMDPSRGASRKGGLQVIETPFAADEEAEFKGVIRYAARDNDDATAIQKQIEAGLRWMTNIGAERTVGFGRLIGVKVDCREKKSLDPVIGETSVTAREVLNIVIQPEGPFCVSRHQPNRNLFESDTVISGGILRGALVTTIQTVLGLEKGQNINKSLSEPFRELGQHFNDIRFGHAFPSPENSAERPVVPPLSLITDESKEEPFINDAALCPGPVVLGDPPRAPSFNIDWKYSVTEHVAKLFGWTEPGRELRVHNAMSRKFRRTEDEMLFAYDMVVPDGFKWLSQVDLSGITDDQIRNRVVSQLRAILQLGLRDIGKTKVFAAIEDAADWQPVYHSNLDPVEGCWIVTLQTPALLCDPRSLDEMSGEYELHQSYAKAWEDISNNSLKLVRFFADQLLAGGYLGHRFMKNKPYNPFLLTGPGSVFVLEATGDQDAAKTFIERWLKQGLDLPQSAKKCYGETWRECPFLPEDGFGEIAVNLSCHTEKRLLSEEVKDALS